MHYQGGKARTGKRIAALIESYRKQDQVYLEPFCGSLSVTQYVSGDRIASDINKALITTFKALQSGWKMPEWITFQEHARLRDNKDYDDPRTAIAGIMFSHGGAWFHHYFGDVTPEKYHPQTLVKKIKSCQNVKFHHLKYDSYNPSNMIIYCDPPYAGTKGYEIAPDFDHEKFWNIIRKWSTNNIVLVSEYQAPDDFNCVLEITTRCTLSNSKTSSPRIEKIFTLNDPPESLFEWPLK